MVRKDDRGFAMVDAVVGIALIALVLGGILAMYGAGWRTEVRALAEYRLESTARGLMTQLIHGDSSQAVAIRGLILAREVITDPSCPGLAYRVSWTDADGDTHDDLVTYYLFSGSLFRLVAPYSGTLAVVPGGGDELAAGVDLFGLSEAGTVPVEIAIAVRDRSGETITLRTRVLPRNLGLGGG